MLALLYFFVKLHMIFVQLYGIAVAKKNTKDKQNNQKSKKATIYIFSRYLSDMFCWAMTYYFGWKITVRQRYWFDTGEDLLNQFWIPVMQFLVWKKCGTEIVFYLVLPVNWSKNKDL